MFCCAGGLRASPVCLCMSKAIKALRAEEKQNRVTNKRMMSVSLWIDGFEMCLCWTQLHKRAMGALPQRLPVPPRTAHHHIQMKCKSPLSPLSAMSIPLWLLLSPYQFSISLLLLRLFSLFILILCLPLLPSALFVFRHRFPISHFSTLPVSLPDGCRLQPTKVRRVYLLFYFFFLEWLWVISH